MTNALTQRAYQTPLSRDRITARCRAFGPPTELPELNCWSIEKHASPDPASVGGPLSVQAKRSMLRFDVAYWKDRRTPNICGLMSVF